jgi:hypothetical protein
LDCDGGYRAIAFTANVKKIPRAKLPIDRA